MPITTVGSYIPVMQEFIAHWTDANAAIAPDTLALHSGYTLANFTAARAAIQAVMDAIEAADNDRQFAATDRDLKKNALATRMTQFRSAVQSLLPGSGYVNMLPRTPPFNSAESTFTRSFADMADLWNAINTDAITGFTPPLLLAEGYARATFLTDLTALRTAYAASITAENASRKARSDRDGLLAPAKERMKQYRLAIKFKLPAGHALLATVPILSPPPGSTPQAVSVAGVWNSTTNKADLTWAASTHPNLASYSVRTAPGPTYKTAEETVVAPVANPQTTYSTDAGLTVPGAVALFKVYVVTDTGNEKGSATVKITRPT